jgi:hypothetical protein
MEGCADATNANGDKLASSKTATNESAWLAGLDIRPSQANSTSLLSESAFRAYIRLKI